MNECFWCDDTMRVKQIVQNGVTYSVEKCDHCGSWRSSLVASPNQYQEDEKRGN